MKRLAALLVLSAMPFVAAAADRPAAAAPKLTRPALFFKEEWKQTPQGRRASGDRGFHRQPEPGIEAVRAVGRDPAHRQCRTTRTARLTSGWACAPPPCAAAFREKTSFADLSGLARIRWNTKMSGFHQVRPIVKLADGTWLIGDHADGTDAGLAGQRDFVCGILKWLKLHIARVVTVGTVPRQGRPHEGGRNRVCRLDAEQRPRPWWLVGRRAGRGLRRGGGVSQLMHDAALEVLLNASRDHAGGEPSETLRRVTRDFLGRARSDVSILKTAAEALPTLPPAGAAWLAVMIGAGIERGQSADLTIPAILECFRSWLPRLPTPEAAEGETRIFPEPTPEQVPWLAAFPQLCQSVVSHLARMPEHRKKLAEDL